MMCARCQDLERQLRDMRGDGICLPPSWGLTPFEGKLLRALIASGRMSRGGLMTAIYGAEEGPFDHIITQMVSRIRRKLRGIGPTIATVSGYGYEIHDHKDWRRKLEEGRGGDGKKWHDLSGAQGSRNKPQRMAFVARGPENLR